MGGHVLNIDGLGFQQIGLHASFLSIPPARYTGKAGGVSTGCSVEQVDTGKQLIWN
jgi:hypothetical protein